MADVRDPAAANLPEQAQHLCRQLQKKDEPLSLTYAIVAFGLVMLVIGVLIEVANFSFALRQLFPVLSSGDPYAEIFPVLKLALGAAVIMAHVLLRQAGARFGDSFSRTLDVIGVFATILLVIGAMLFMAGSLTHIDADNGAATGSIVSASWALSLLLMALFPISILSNHVMLGLISKCLTKIEAIWNNRRRIRRIAAQIAEVESAEVAVAATTERVAELTEGAKNLDWEIATELAAVPGNLAAETNDFITVREVIDQSGGDISARDTLPDIFREMPLTTMQALRDYQKSFSVESIFKVLRTRKA
jgi:hypothetical protein